MRAAARVGLAQHDDLFHRQARLDLIERVVPGLDADQVARVHRELGRLLGIEPTPLDGILGGLQPLRLGVGGSGQKQHQSEQSHVRPPLGGLSYQVLTVHGRSRMVRWSDHLTTMATTASRTRKSSSELPELREVRKARRYEQVAEQIQRLILRGVLKPGDRLPPERELTRKFGVARSSIRDAIRTLE